MVQGQEMTLKTKTSNIRPIHIHKFHYNNLLSQPYILNTFVLGTKVNNTSRF
jgi:hypothetical protein